MVVYSGEHVSPQGRKLVLGYSPGIWHDESPGKVICLVAKEIETFVRSCSNCQEHRHAPPVAPLHPWEWPAQPWSKLHLDYAGPFKGHMYLIIVDAHSKWLDHSFEDYREASASVFNTWSSEEDRHGQWSIVC